MKGNITNCIYTIILPITLMIAPLSIAVENIIQKSVVVNVGSAKVIDLPFTPGDVLKGDLGATDVNPDTGEDKEPSNTIFEAKKKDNKIRIRGLTRGSGNLEVFDSRGKKRMIIWVYITSPQKGRMIASLKKALADVEGIKIYPSGDDIIIDGELFTQKDRARIEKIVDQMSTGTEKEGAKIINLTSYSPLFMRTMAKKIEKEINDPNVRVIPLKDKFRLEGTVVYTAPDITDEKSKARADEALAAAQRKLDRYEKIADAYLSEQDYVGKKADAENKGFQVIINTIQLQKKSETQEQDKLVRIQFDFVELSKNYLKKFGFNWSPGIFSGSTSGAERKEMNMLGDSSSASFGENGLTATITGTIRNLIPKLYNAKQFGHAKVLESSQIITKNTTEAFYKAGTQILLPMRTENGDRYEKINFGVETKYTPTIIDKTNTVSLVININYQTIPEGGKITATSNIPTHELRSTMLIESGASAAIAGLVKNFAGNMFDEIPNGIENNFLTIYHSKDFLQGKSQMIMFLTPTIVENASTGSEELKRKFRMK